MPDAFIPKDRTQRIQKPIKLKQSSSSSRTAPPDPSATSSAGPYHTELKELSCVSALRTCSVIICICGVAGAILTVFNPIIAVSILFVSLLCFFLLRAAAFAVQAVYDTVDLLWDIRDAANAIDSRLASTQVSADQCRLALSGMDDTLDQILAAVTPAPAPEEAAPQAPAE